jgi:hypothetical protein
LSTREKTTLRALESEGIKGIVDGFHKVTVFAKNHDISTYDAFERSAGTEQKEIMKQLCENLQGALKISGDWQIYPFGVHDLIASGRVEVSHRTVFIDGRQMPDYGYRSDSQIPF